MSRRTSRRVALLALGDRLRDLTTTAEMTHAAAEIVGRTLGATRAGFGRVVGDVEVIEIDPDWTAPGHVSVAGRHRYDDYGDIREHLRRGEPLIVDDVTEDPRTTPMPRSGRTRHQRLHSHACPRAGTYRGGIHRPRRAGAAGGPSRSWRSCATSRPCRGRRRTVCARGVAGRAQQGTGPPAEEYPLIVQSIATQTLRGIAEREPVEAFERRVLALSRAHDVLMQKSWTAAKLRAVMESVLSMQADIDRFALDGRTWTFPRRPRSPCRCCCTKLATNALKYGALSAETGTVRIAWRTEADRSPTSCSAGTRRRPAVARRAVAAGSARN